MPPGQPDGKGICLGILTGTRKGAQVARDNDPMPVVQPVDSQVFSSRVRREVSECRPLKALCPRRRERLFPAPPILSCPRRKKQEKKEYGDRPEYRPAKERLKKQNPEIGDNHKPHKSGNYHQGDNKLEANHEALHCLSLCPSLRRHFQNHLFTTTATGADIQCFIDLSSLHPDRQSCPPARPPACQPQRLVG